MSCLRRAAWLTWDNPILLKELRIGLRERKIFLIQTLYLVVLGFATAFFLVSVSGPQDMLDMSDHGTYLHQVLFWCQLVMVLLITPSLTCGQISGERENRTMDLLAATRLGTFEIVTGKLGYAVSFVGLLLTSSLPMVAVVFLLGGVSPMELAGSYMLLVAGAVLAGLLGLFYSSREKRTLFATNQTYGTLILLFVLGSPMIPILLQLLGGSLVQGPSVLGGWTLPWPVILGFNALCAALFLSLKVQNHLRRRAVHEIWMGRLFLAWYLADMAVLGLFAAAATDSEEAAAFWLLGLLAVQVAMGCFLGPRPFASPRDEAVRSRALTFRWFTWVALLMTGLGFMAALQWASGALPEAIGASLGLALAMLLALSAMARGLHAVSGGAWKLAPIYYLLLAATTFLPLPALTSNDDPLSFWLGAQVSPAASMVTIWAEGAPKVELLGTTMEMASACLVTWLGLTVAVALLALARRALRPQKA